MRWPCGDPPGAAGGYVPGITGSGSSAQPASRRQVGRSGAANLDGLLRRQCVKGFGNPGSAFLERSSTGPAHSLTSRFPSGPAASGSLARWKRLSGTFNATVSAACSAVNFVDRYANAGPSGPGLSGHGRVTLDPEPDRASLRLATDAVIRVAEGCTPTLYAKCSTVHAAYQLWT